MSSIGSTLNSINNSLLSEISSYYASSNTDASTQSTNSTTAPTSDTIDFSQVAQLFQQLKQLQTSDPAEFKQVLTDAASKLKAAAQQQTDPAQATFLSNLADRFQKAADTGNLSALQPSSNSSSGSYGPQGHHHHHHEGRETQESASNTQNLLATLLANQPGTPNKTS